MNNSADSDQNKTLDLSGESRPADTVTLVSSHSVPPVDLSNEGLLKPAPRIFFNQLNVPALGGIPLLAKLGQGGMGAVYFGIHTRLMLEVAVKVLPFQLANQDPTLVQRFFREAQIAAKVKSPHLVSVMDVNEEAGLFYLVMEFVHGKTAGEYTRAVIYNEKLPGLSEITALDICIAATEGLIAAHAAGIIHRDIKPENILLPRDKQTGDFNFKAAKLSDLGLARNDESVQSLTAAQNVMGTPGFMSPEQANDAKNAGKPADVFSMGATLYAMLAGHPPFSGNTTLEMILNTIQKTHRSIVLVRPDVSLETSTMIDRCLSKRAERRFEDAVALMKALTECRSLLNNRLTRPARGSGGVRVIQAAAAPQTLQTHAVDPNQQTVPLRRAPGAAPAVAAAPVQYVSAPPRTRRGNSIVFLLLGAALLVAGGLWLSHEHQLADDARAENERQAEESAKADAAKAAENKEVLARKAQRDAQRAKDAELEAMRQKALHDAEEAQKRLNAPPQPSIETAHADVPPKNQELPEPQHPVADPLARKNLPERLQRARKIFNTANEEAQRAVQAQQQAADRVNSLVSKQHTAADALQKMRKQIQDLRDELHLDGPGPGGPGGPGPGGQERPGAGIGPGPGGRGRRPEPPKEKMEALHELEDAEEKVAREVHEIERQYDEALIAYNKANDVALEKLNTRMKLQNEVETIIKAAGN
jgi:hypothetical protein